VCLAGQILFYLCDFYSDERLGIILSGRSHLIDYNAGSS
jgi:hypothetical protein